MEILETTWFSGMDGCIGIVKIKNERGEIKHYIGKGHGIDEGNDARMIARNGSPVHPEQLIPFLQRGA